MTVFTANLDMARGRTLRSALLAALAGAALLLGSCSRHQADGNPQGNSGGTASDAHGQAVTYAKCMRENGVPSWPDPDQDGRFPNENGNLDRTSDAFKKADAKCRGPEQAPPDAADIDAQFQQLLAYSKCMRANGVDDFPDPTKAGGGVGIEAPKDLDANSPQVKKALAACRTLPGAPEDQG